MSLVTPRVVSSPESPYNDCAETLANILKDYKDSIPIKYYYAYDPWYIASLPAAAVEFVNCSETVPALGTHRLGGTHNINYDLSLKYRIWYYHEQVSKKMNDEEMLQKLWKINSIYKTHPTINGYNTIGYSRITNVEAAARERENSTFAGGFIEIIVTRRICHDHDPVVVPPL